MPILGAHMSIAGGYHLAAERAAEVGCDCVQIFTKPTTQWRSPPISPEQARQFQEALHRYSLQHPYGHDSYLVNLASPKKRLWKKSIDAFVEELHRAELLGLPWLVFHPGAYLEGEVSDGLNRVSMALKEVFRQITGLQVGCLVETTAGQGTTLGYRFEHLAELLARSPAPERMGVCFDTCHVFAAGYPLSPRKAWEATLQEFDRIVGLQQIRCFHLNDSLRPCGSRVDRHAHIGQGQIGREPFRWLLQDPRFQQIPMYLETPKGTAPDGQDWDRKNLALLRQLAEEKPN
ncbi:MAG: deoxyribonuclease IV [Thermoguttaceae bacterium]|nr:deoxyribonuclease IV [Thermoguttaceae bacterium]MDW8036679.1 deoxyribonuclease IV [Thermoguttaceae bacterium]